MTSTKALLPCVAWFLDVRSGCKSWALSIDPQPGHQYIPSQVCTIYHMWGHRTRPVRMSQGPTTSSRSEALTWKAKKPKVTTGHYTTKQPRMKATGGFSGRCFAGLSQMLPGKPSSQVAKTNRLPNSKVAPNSLKIAHNYRPLAFQVDL